LDQTTSFPKTAVPSIFLLVVEAVDPGSKEAAMPVAIIPNLVDRVVAVLATHMENEQSLVVLPKPTW